MISFKIWREQITPATPGAQSEQPTEEDFNFYHAKLSGNIKRYLQWLVEELEATDGKLNTIRKGFIMQEVMDALGLNAGQVARLSNNIKKGFQAWQAAQKRTTPSSQPKVPGTTMGKSPTTPGVPTGPIT